MKKNLRISIIIFISAVVLIFLLGHFSIISILTRNSIFYAVLTSLINFILFYILTELSYKKSNKIFLLYNMGGMGVRILLMLFLVFLTIKFLKVDELEYIFTFFLFYVLFLVYEINLIRLKVEKQKASKDTDNVV